MLGGGGGGGGGGSNRDAPGGIITCAEAALAKSSADANAPMMIDEGFMRGYVGIPPEKRNQIILQAPVGRKARQVP
jgi:hypothetical protein